MRLTNTRRYAHALYYELYDKKEYKEINRIIEKELHTTPKEKFIVEQITVIVAHNKQIKLIL